MAKADAGSSPAGGILRTKMQKVYILKTDGDGTTFSIDKPFGVVVTSKEEAERFVKEGKFGYTHSFEEAVVFDNKDDALDFYRKKHL